jgi:hypothetical protein
MPVRMLAAPENAAPFAVRPFDDVQLDKLMQLWPKLSGEVRRSIVELAERSASVFSEIRPPGRLARYPARVSLKLVVAGAIAFRTVIG